MGWSSSLILIAIGAVLRWAVTVTPSGINLHTVGLIVMIVGAIGFIISMAWMLNWIERDRSAAAPPVEGYYPPRQRI